MVLQEIDDGLSEHSESSPVAGLMVSIVVAAEAAGGIAHVMHEKNNAHTSSASKLYRCLLGWPFDSFRLWGMTELRTLDDVKSRDDVVWQGSDIESSGVPRKKTYAGCNVRMHNCMVAGLGKSRGTTAAAGLLAVMLEDFTPVQTA